MGLLDSLFGGSKTEAWGPQADFLSGLYGKAGSLAKQQAPGLQGLFGLSQNLQGQGQGFVDQLGQAGSQLAPFAQQSFAPQQIAGLADLLNQNFTQNLLPGISQAGIASGGFGGGRGQVAAGVGAGQTNRALFQGAGSILQQDLLRQQQAAATAGQQGIQGALGGLTGLQSLFGLAQAPYQAQWGPLLNAANIGSVGPTMQQSSQGGILPGIGGFLGMGMPTLPGGGGGGSILGTILS